MILRFKMRIFFMIMFVALSCLHANAAETITMDSAIKLAEIYVAENGYTDSSASDIKQALDYESIEWTSSRKELLNQRRNTLLPKAIGVKRGRKNDDAGWSVAFDYTSQRSNPGACRVVTMKPDGTKIRIEHVEGIRKYFVGFEKT